MIGSDISFLFPILYMRFITTAEIMNIAMA